MSDMEMQDRNGNWWHWQSSDNTVHLDERCESFGDWFIREAIWRGNEKEWFVPARPKSTA